MNSDMQRLRNVDARVLLASENPNGDQLVTMLMRYPRWLHAEVMTHRMFSRNAASSRAIPVHRMLRMIEDDPATPEHWGAEQRGMQSGDVLSNQALAECQTIWREARLSALGFARRLAERGLHKSLINRLVEPWMPYTVLVSATSWSNFFALRAHPDAQPEFQLLAYRAANAYLKAPIQKLQWGQWHIPFGDRMPEGLSENQRIKVAVARAARLSYLTHEGEMDVEKDLELYSRLMERDPLHASPAEHVAMASPCLTLDSDVGRPESIDDLWVSDGVVRGKCRLPLPYDHDLVHQGNFRGFTQWRKMQPNEHVERIDLRTLIHQKPPWITL